MTSPRFALSSRRRLCSHQNVTPVPAHRSMCAQVGRVGGRRRRRPLGPDEPGAHVDALRRRRPGLPLPGAGLHLRGHGLRRLRGDVHRRRLHLRGHAPHRRERRRIPCCGGRLGGNQSSKRERSLPDGVEAERPASRVDVRAGGFSGTIEVDASMTSPEACQILCANDAACSFWSYEDECAAVDHCAEIKVSRLLRFGAN